MPVTGHIRSASEVDAGRREEMFALMDHYYENMRRDEFDTDLNEKHWVIEIENAVTGELVGFSTQMVFDVDINSRTCRALYSGDTIVAQEHRLRNPLAGLWGRLALYVLEQSPDRDLYWFLISKGYKTYRFLPLFFHEFFPRFDQPTPTHVADTLDALARFRFTERYDSKAKIVRAERKSCRLRVGVADVSHERMRDRHIQFFCERNPGHTTGDELCCVAPLKTGNFTPAAWKMIKAVECAIPDTVAR